MSGHASRACPGTSPAMKRFVKNTFLILTAFVTVGLSSCIYDKSEEPETAVEEQPADDQVWVRINVSGNPSADNTNFSSFDPIHSLRVVILDSEGKVQFNQKERFETPVSTYYFNALVKAGKNTFYFIANADNMNLYESANSLPTTEEAFFSQFTLGTTGFEEAVKNLYFDNTYFATPSNPLPLTSKYVVTTEPGVQDLSFWLVKAATKYTVHFENSRTSEVFLNDLYVSQLIDKMYLMPHVGSTQETISGQYWVEWLRDVADKSHLDESNQGDEAFNDRYGWITDYTVPTPNTPFNLYLVKEGNIEIPGLQTSAGQAKPEPGTLDLGPFYSTEGLNLLPGNAAGIQQYTVTIKVTDTKDNAVFSEYRVLPNLSALFRNTHVIINITFDESYMHIYGEIADWREYTIYGDVTEEK